MKRILLIVCFLLIVITAKSQSDIITPELVLEFNENPKTHNMHITCDGQFYYTCNGGIATDGQINKYSMQGNLIASYSIPIDMRSIMYNPNDNSLYVSSYDKNIYKINNLANSSYTVHLSNFTSNGSAAISSDGKYLYTLNSNKFNIYNSASGAFIKSFNNITYGSEYTVAVDNKYFYTFGSSDKEIKVYDLGNGNFIKTLYVSKGNYNYSLSIANNLLFVSIDGNYETGTWYGYKIRETQQIIENDFTSPEISIYEPSVSLGFKIVEANKQIFVKGKATDNSGIYEVTINGIDANVNVNGDFQQNVKLAIGDNTITIKATDTKNNSGTYTFYVNRQDVVNNDIVINDNPINEKRIALVIGNSNYGGGQSLKNPANDANLISTTLQNLGFEVIKRIDANKQSMEQAIRDFSKKLSSYNVALFYYAGHGVQVDGLNYLIPTDAKLNDKSDCKFEAISVNYVVEEFEKYPNNVNVVILDACRNDPFRSWARGGERGFKAIAPTSGTIISFATSEGSTASDGTGNNGLFTEQLVKQMYVPQPIESVFKKTRVEVERVSNGAQSPQEWSKLKGDFYFKK